jgi:hypothetical protein
MARLLELEYLLAHRGGRGQSFLFELLYEGQGKDGSRFVLGLLDDEKLGYDANRSGFLERWSGRNEEQSGLGRPLVGPESGGDRGDEIAPEAAPDAALLHVTAALAEKVPTGPVPKNLPSKSSPRRNGHRLTLNLLRFPPVKGDEREKRREPRRSAEPVLA